MTSANRPATKRGHRAVAAVFAIAMVPSIYAQEPHDHRAGSDKQPAPFIASTAKPFPALMDDAMDAMDFDMTRSPMNGVPEHDFVTMMIPHHQGAIDMAKALLLYTKNPEMMNLAQGIITEQQNEIRLMQAWLQRYRDQHGRALKSRK